MAGRAIGRTLFSAAALCLLAACASIDARRPALDRQVLLSGPASLAASPAGTVAMPSEAEVMGLDEDMRSFVASQVGHQADPDARIKDLLIGMKNRGLFSLDYSDTLTQAARKTFHEQRGNCLSFTMLFVALAREAGLRVDYQLVDIPPQWTGDPELLIVSNHINTLVRRISGSDLIVDFNQDRFKESYPTHKISDAHVMALFYSNLGVEALTEGRRSAAFLYFRKAIQTDSAVPGPWVNLGLLYARLGFNDYAESAYLQALDADPRDRSALTNLTALYQKLGDQQLVETYRKKIRFYEQRNPYYQYALAQAAYHAQRLEEALELLDKAIRLKADEYLFYDLQGTVYVELGESGRASDSYVQAAKHADTSEARTQYMEKARALATGRGGRESRRDGEGGRASLQ